MKRLMVLLYGTISYAIFFAVFLYSMGFVGNFFVPNAIDSAPSVPLAQALLINLGLLGLFAVQHSLMARPLFKRWITRFIPKAAERSTYVMASNLAMIALFLFWAPMGIVVWNLDSTLAQAAMWIAFGFGWMLVLVSTFMINHFDLFGLRQVWLYFRKREYTPLQFRTTWAYRWIRHPIYLGWLFAFWATPTMTIAHLVFALMTTAYIFIAIVLEEKDLSDAHEEYVQYKEEVPMIFPVPGRSATTA